MVHEMLTPHTDEREATRFVAPLRLAKRSPFRWLAGVSTVITQPHHEALSTSRVLGAHTSMMAAYESLAPCQPCLSRKIAVGSQLAGRRPVLPLISGLFACNRGAGKAAHFFMATASVAQHADTSDALMAMLLLGVGQKRRVSGKILVS